MNEKDLQFLELMADVFVKQNGLKVAAPTLELIQKIYKMSKDMEILQKKFDEEIE